MINRRSSDLNSDWISALIGCIAMIIVLISTDNLQYLHPEYKFVEFKTLDRAIKICGFFFPAALMGKILYPLCIVLIDAFRTQRSDAVESSPMRTVSIDLPPESEYDLDAEIARLDADASVRSTERYVLLRPVIASPLLKCHGWFGGAPCLPSEMQWPELYGEQYRFVCQIDLTGLPKDLWSGLGPRTGALAVFIHPQSRAPKILHLTGQLEQRVGPDHRDAIWFYDSAEYVPLEGSSKNAFMMMPGTGWVPVTRSGEEGIAAMGHHPNGEIETPVGASDDHVVLLELPTSKPLGWIWGDCYSIVLLISRADLANSNFDNVDFEITN